MYLYGLVGNRGGEVERGDGREGRGGRIGRGSGGG